MQTGGIYHHSTLTVQEEFCVVLPFDVIGRVRALEPDEGALEVVLGHGAEAHAGVGADDGAVELPLRDARVQRLEEDPHADRHQGRQHPVEYEVEQSDLC